jgi:hypothetical protein
MSSESNHIGLYWAARQCSIDEATEECLLVFSELIKAGFDRFFLKARSKSQALKNQLTLSRDVLAELLSKGRNRRDTDEAIIEDLGFSLSLWSGHDDEDETYALNIFVGSYSKFVGNCLVLDLPNSGPRSAKEHGERLSTLVAKLAEILQPERIVTPFLDGPKLKAGSSV